MRKADIQKTRIDYSSQNLQVLPRLDGSFSTLIADNNSITSLNNLPNHLISLSLVKNKIAFLGNLEAQAPYLESLNLSSNRLISLEGITSCVCLKELKISNNYVGDDQILLLAKLKKLVVLDVSHNHLRDLAFMGVLKQLTEIEEIWNAANDFCEWSMDFSLKNLKRLVLDGNKIRSLELKDQLPSLEVLSAKENNLVNIDGIKNCPKLYEVDFTGNDISQLNDEWSALRELKVAILKNNSLKELPHIQTLEVIDASHNSLNNVMNLSRKLKEVFLAHNSIADLPSLPNLVTGDFSFNKLSSIIGLSNSASLQCLNIGHNLFTSPALVLKHLQSSKTLKALDLQGLEINPQALGAFHEAFPVLESFNGLNLASNDDPSRRHLNSIRASQGWDSLSKSKLFPSCRSSLNEMDKNGMKTSINEFSIFSDIKTGNSFNSSIATSQKFKDLAEDSQAHLVQDSEYELLAKELEINNRIQKLDLQARQLGDSLISRKNSDGQNPDLLTGSKDHILRFNDSLISKRNGTAEIKFTDSKPLPPNEPVSSSDRSKTPHMYRIEKTEEISSKVIQNPALASNRSESSCRNYGLDVNRMIKNRTNEKRTQDSQRTGEKEESTISFEISNEISREKPPREPLKIIHDNHKSKRTKCCRHCCKKRKRSVNLQTTIKEEAPESLDIPKFMDQATSPMNSILKVSSIHSHRSSSKHSADYFPYENPVANQYQTFNFFNKSPSLPKTNRSFLDEHPILSRRNNSFLCDSDKESVSHKAIDSKRSSTPLVSYRNTPNRTKETDMNQMLNYACTPPRPILASEANSPLLCRLSAKGTEFFLISQIFEQQDRTVKEVVKTYTYSLQKAMHISRPETFLHKDIEPENGIFFFSAAYKDLEAICNSSEGFAAVYRSAKDVWITSVLSAALQGKQQVSSVLMVLASLKSIVQVKPSCYQMMSTSKIVPIYLVEFL